MVPTLGTGGIVLTDPDGPACGTGACTRSNPTSAAATSPLIGDITVTVKVGGTTLVSLNIHVDFSQNLAKASYAPRPSGA
jgi:hypothetical protein